MTDDLAAAVAALHGHDLSDARRQAVLARLDTDADFRRAVAAELHLLGLLQVVRAGEPRWLRLRAEIDTHAPADSPPAFEDAVLATITRHQSRRRLRWAAVAAAVLAVVAGGRWVGRPRAETVVAPPRAGEPVAVLTVADGVQWEAGGSAVGGRVAPGLLRFHAGMVTLSFVTGVTLTADGPADLDIRSAAEVACRRGRVRVRVPVGAEGFALLTPGGAVIDRGTEFGANVTAGGPTDVWVFEGRADVTVFDGAGRLASQESLAAGQGAHLDPAAVSLTAAAVPAGEFPDLAVPAVPPLPLDPGYRTVRAAANPWAYWPFETARDGWVPSAVPGRFGLTLQGRVGVAPGPNGLGVATFAPDDPTQALVADADWVPPRATGYAVELWFLADGYLHTSLAGLVPSRPGEVGHTFMIELLNRRPGPVGVPCAVRGLDRWPPGRMHGANLYSQAEYIPNRWYHVVAQRAGPRFALFVNGDLVETATDAGTDTGPTRLILGRMEPGPTRDHRTHAGRLAEVAVYDRLLTVDEVRRHAAGGE